MNTMSPFVRFKKVGMSSSSSFPNKVMTSLSLFPAVLKDNAGTADGHLLKQGRLTCGKIVRRKNNKIKHGVFSTAQACNTQEHVHRTLIAWMTYPRISSRETRTTTRVSSSGRYTIPHTRMTRPWGGLPKRMLVGRGNVESFLRHALSNPICCLWFNEMHKSSRKRVDGTYHHKTGNSINHTEPLSLRSQLEQAALNIL